MVTKKMEKLAGELAWKHRGALQYEYCENDRDGLDWFILSQDGKWSASLTVALDFDMLTNRKGVERPLTGEEVRSISSFVEDLEDIVHEYNIPHLW